MIRQSPFTLASLAADLTSGAVSARGLVEDCLARIENRAGEGARTFVRVDAAAARTAAEAFDSLRAADAHPSPFAGIPISIKDLYDIAGQPTRAASRTRTDAPPVAADAPAVARLRAAGFVLIGRANMTEFAYSGLGLNPHTGTPRSVWQRDVCQHDSGRAPGGSSSGGGVSVADAMAHASLGSDTGGSCRIPAAFNGVAGFKPTQARMPGAGMLPLSTTLDTAGPLARSVACCAVLDAILAGEPVRPLPALPLAGLRLAVPQTIVLENLDAQVADAFAAALKTLAEAGARLAEIAVPEFAEVLAMGRQGGISAAEAYAWHRENIDAKAQDYDPRVRARIMRGAEQCAADYIDLLATRRRLVASAAVRLVPYDAMLMPTVACVPPRLADLARDDDYVRINARVLRNTNMINILDGCAVTLPMHPPDTAPVGLMVAGGAGCDRHVLAVGAAIEAHLSRR